MPPADFDDFDSYVALQNAKPKSKLPPSRKYTRRESAVNAAMPKHGDPIPPDGVPKTSVLASSAPTVALLSPLTPHKLAVRASQPEATEEVDKIERRVGLLARYIIEDLLWDAEGWSKKERYDAAVKAIATLEGTKERLWVRDEQQKIPFSQEELVRERKATEERLRGLLKLKGAKKGELAEAAQAVVEVEAPMVKGGDA